MARIGNEIEPLEVLREDVGMGNDDDEDPLEAEIPRVRMNPKNPTNRVKQEHEDSGHAVYRCWCATCVEGRGVGVLHRIELLEEEERLSLLTSVSRHKKMLTHFRSGFVLTARLVKREQLAVNGKVLLHILCYFWSVSSKILAFADSY